MAPKKKSSTKPVSEAAAAEKPEEVKVDEPEAKKAKTEETKEAEPKKEEPKKAEEPKKEESKSEAEPKKEAAPTTTPAAEVAAKEPEKPAEPEKPKEPEFVEETDAAADNRAKVKADAVYFSQLDATMNVMPVCDGHMLMTLVEGGMQYLLASTRATAGIKKGRYMFEAKVAESLSVTEPPDSRAPQPKQLVRLGFSLGGSSLFLGDTQDSFCFDLDGFFIHGKKRQRLGQKIGSGTAALVLNLDASSAHANTASLFANGARVGKPIPLPENFVGKTLYPTVTYRNVTLSVNLGPTPKVPLPFKCRMIGDAAADDLAVTKEPSSDGPYEVLLPVGLPDEGFFDWIDAFTEKNPQYIELSDRKIIEWAGKSGMTNAKRIGSNDSPAMNFSIPAMDDGSAKKVIASIAAVQKRNYIIGDLKGNLTPAGRKEVLARFNAPFFKKKTVVLMGEPNAEYKDKINAMRLVEKKETVEKERKRKAIEAERKRLLEEKKKKAEEAKKARLAAARAKEGKEEEAGEPAAATEEQETAGVAKEEEPEADGPIELTEEEKKNSHRKLENPDLTEKALSASFGSFALPTKAEGFSEVSYTWQPESVCTEHLKVYRHELKKVMKADHLKPSKSFKEQHVACRKRVAEYRKQQSVWSDPKKREEFLKKRKEDGKEDKEIDAEEIEPTSVEDVTDIGNGQPLFSKFTFEDWALAMARFELHLLLHSFRKDLDDPDRASFPEAHLGFYFNKYFDKKFELTTYDCKEFSEFVSLIPEVFSVNAESKLLETKQPEDSSFEHFLKLTEESRRDRERRYDAGDETAILKFPRPQPAPPTKPPAVGARPVVPGSVPAAAVVRPGPPAVGLKRPQAPGMVQGQPPVKQIRPVV